MPESRKDAIQRKGREEHLEQDHTRRSEDQETGGKDSGRIPADPAECTAARSGEYAGRADRGKQAGKNDGEGLGLESRSGNNALRLGHPL